MNRIVEKPLKVDFHIHSEFSKYKDDYSLVKEGTISNIDKLVTKLNENNINMVSITDHDFFSYDMYSALKKHEGEGTLQKVLPGVEFSVGFESLGETITVHIIVIFDDKDTEKVKNIENILTVTNNKINYDGGNFFKEETFIKILNKIGLNVVLIAHQKQSVNSKKHNANDLNTLGEDKFDEFLKCEVFEALEFKSMKSGLFNNLFAIEKNKEYEIVRFITGSDCHQWDVYPKHDSKESDDVDFHFTYLKCLASFKGLCMALSDYSRISLSDSLFSQDDKKITSIDLKIGSSNYSIPMSKGINVIIGDNSIGKSLLIHKISNYKYLEDNKIKAGYESYLLENNIKIYTQIQDTALYHFDKQGEIRERFQTKDEKKNQEFLQSKFPLAPSDATYKALIKEKLECLFLSIENKFLYDNEYKKLPTLNLVSDDIKAKNLSVSKFMFNKDNVNKLTKLVRYLLEIQAKISDPENQKDNGLEDKDLNEIVEINDKLSNMIARYKEKLSSEQRTYNIKTAMNLGIDAFNSNLLTYKTGLEKQNDAFNDNVISTANSIALLIQYKRKNKHVDFSNLESVQVESNINNYGDYSFVKRFKNVKRIDKDYLISLIASPFKKGFQLNETIVTENDLISYFKEKKEFETKTALEQLKERIYSQIIDDFEVESLISKKDSTVDLSSGLNSKIYFDIISDDNQKGIYIIDQPEDDVSQKSIKESLLLDFKKMSEKRQIILITHNPQFVVNLDADNVICFTKDNGTLSVQYGALEYEDNETNIIQLVADNLDGGVDSIKKRWKRYGKEIRTNQKG